MKLCLSLLLVFPAYFSFSQDLQFNRLYGTPAYEDSRSIVRTSDGCFVVAGLDKGGDDIDGDAYLMKLNPAGGMMWKKYYGLPLEDGVNKMIPTNDDGLLLIGHVDINNNICDGYIIKTNEDGDKNWSLQIGDINDDLFFDGVQTAEGDYYLTGCHENPLTGNMDMYFVKVSQSGALEFAKGIDAGHHEVGTGIQQTTDGNFVICGFAIDINDEVDCHIAKVDPNGNVIWQNTFGTANQDRLWDAQALENGDIIVAGGSYNTDIEEGIVAYVTADGQVNDQTLNASGQKLYFRDIAEINGKYAICGYGKEATGTNDNMVLCIIDQNLNLEHQSMIEHPGDNWGYGVLPLNEFEYILTGLQIESVSKSDIMISRIDTRSSAGVGPTFSGESILFPNPFEDFFYCQLNGVSGIKELHLYTLDGKEIFTTQFSENEFFYSRNGLESGTYLYTIENESGVNIATGKITAL